jgi:hypothetical protein
MASLFPLVERNAPLTGRTHALAPDGTAPLRWSRSALRWRNSAVPAHQAGAPHFARGNAARARERSRVEHVFAAEKHRMGLVVRTVGLLRANAKITLANLAYNLSRMVWIEGRAAPA